jgi:hypothetical protein|tara:strand:+ start:230 stop:604 length:375 start_codon:yes stop_codon:yes gene_type:complete
MPIITLNFPNQINVSVQTNPTATPLNPKGADIVYFTPTNTIGVHDTATQLVELGPVISKTSTTLTVNYTGGATPSDGDYIMFAKSRDVNMSSLLGYFSKFRVRNNSTDKSELYSIAVDVFESSK